MCVDLIVFIIYKKKNQFRILYMIMSMMDE